MKQFLAIVFFSLAGLVRAEEPRKPLPPTQVKQAFLKLLDRDKVAAEVKLLSEPKAEGGLVTEHFSFASEKKADDSIERVPVLLVRPEGQGKFPAVIVLHGTGGNKDGQKGWLVDLAKRGIIGLAIDARYHGERAAGAKGSTAYVAAITRAWRTPKGQPAEHPFYYDTCWDLWRTLDYLQTRPDVDAERLGMIGTSMGGIETWLAGSVDERVKVAVPLIGVQSFRWSLENDRWQGRARTITAAHEAAAKDLGEPMVNAKVCRALWGKVIPGILDDFDCPNMIPLFAGRPLLIANGELDQNCPIEGARLAFAAAEDAFAKAGAKEKLHIVTGPGGHTVTPEFRKEALEWCEKWLGR
jgi:dienelactone hydrolase